MTAKVLILVTLASVALFVASATEDSNLEAGDSLTLPDYNFTKAAYMGFTKDTQFDTDYFDFVLKMTKVTYEISSREGKNASGKLTFDFNASQTIQNTFGKRESIEYDENCTVTIVNNIATDVSLPAKLNVDIPAVKKLATAYAQYVLPTPMSGDLALPETNVNAEILRNWAPGTSYQPKYTPDMNLKFFGFSSNLRQATEVQGTITFKINASSEFLGYTQRQHGESRSVTAVPITIELTDDIKNPKYKIDPVAIKPFVVKDVEELVKAFYKNVIRPAIKKLFA